MLKSEAPETLQVSSEYTDILLLIIYNKGSSYQSAKVQSQYVGFPFRHWFFFKYTNQCILVDLTGNHKVIHSRGIGDRTYDLDVDCIIQIIHQNSYFFFFFILFCFDLKLSDSEESSVAHQSRLRCGQAKAINKWNKKVVFVCLTYSFRKIAF